MTGGLAQLGEHLLCKQGVVGSIPTGSTTAERVKSLHTERFGSEPALRPALRSLKTGKRVTSVLVRTEPRHVLRHEQVV